MAMLRAAHKTSLPPRLTLLRPWMHVRVLPSRSREHFWRVVMKYSAAPQEEKAMCKSSRTLTGVITTR